MRLIVIARTGIIFYGIIGVIFMRIGHGFISARMFLIVL